MAKWSELDDQADTDDIDITRTSGRLVSNIIVSLPLHSHSDILREMVFHSKAESKVCS